MSLLAVVGAGIVVFATTNIDDILLLSAFFADRALHARSVVVGQFVGIGALTAASAAAALFALAIPEGWIGLLGLAPLALGVRRLLALPSSRTASDAEEAERLHAAEARVERVAHSRWIAVALVTVANGGDNLGVYIPLFAHTPAWIPVYAAVFAVMTGLWCAAGHRLVQHPILGTRIRQCGHVSLPFVLIGLGLYILSDARPLLR